LVDDAWNITVSSFSNIFVIVLFRSHFLLLILFILSSSLMVLFPTGRLSNSTWSKY